MKNIRVFYLKIFHGEIFFGGEIFYIFEWACFHEFFEKLGIYLDTP